MDDLPFAFWVGRIPTFRVESKGPGGGCPSLHNSLAVSTALSLHIRSKNSSRKDVTSKINQKAQVGLAFW